jgi:hypothetical protein
MASISNGSGFARATIKKNPNGITQSTYKTPFNDAENRADIGGLISDGEVVGFDIQSVTITDNITSSELVAQPKRASVGLDELSPEIREYLGLPDSLERKTCGRCEEERLMDDKDYLCRKCRYG